MLPQAAKLPGTSGLFKNKLFLIGKICPRQRSCPGQVACSKKNICLEKTAPSSEAARDKRFVQKKSQFLKTSSAPGSEAAPDTWLLQKSQISGKKFCPGQVFRSRESEQPLRPRARSGFWGVRGGEAPRKSRGVRGGAAPPPPVPRIRAK